VKLLRDKKGDAVLLFMLFLIILSILFMQVVYSVSRGIGAREYLVKVCDEIALNIVTSAVDMASMEAGTLVIDMSEANTIANDTFRSLGIPVQQVNITVKNRYVYVTAVVSGEMFGISQNITVTGMAKARDVR